jgi:hypothetical protein
MYWLVALALVVFGFLAAFSIGQPFLFLGLAMIAVGPWRRRPRVFWPVVAGVVAFNVAYLAFAPLVCTATVNLGGAIRTTCTNLLGIPYEGGAGYNPSLLPARLAGLAVGIAVAVLTELLVVKRRVGVALGS